MRTWSILGLALTLAACDGGDGGTDGGGTDGGGSTPIDVTWTIRDTDETPLPGASVAVDLGDGTRLEETADGSGQVTFSIDFGPGPIAITAYAPGHQLVSIINLTEATLPDVQVDGANVISLFEYGAASVTLSGTISGVTSATNRLGLVASLSGAGPAEITDTAYTMPVPTGSAFRIAAIEFGYDMTGPTDYTRPIFSLSHHDVDALTADTTLDIDFSSSETLTEVDGTVASPGMGTPLADASFAVEVTDAESFAEFYGGQSAVTSNGDNVDYTITHGDLSLATTPITRFFLIDAPNLSIVVVDGPPAAGMQDVVFPPPPEIITPAFGVMHPLHDPFEVGRIEPGLRVSITLYDLEQDDRALWRIVRVGDSMGTITVPQPPSAVDRAELFPSTGDIYARPFGCERHSTGSYCARSAVGGRAFDLVP